MKAFTLFLLLFAPFVTSAQWTDSLYLQEMKAYQQKLNKEYADPAESPLEPEALKDFKELPFFPVNEKYHINARFVRTPGSKPFKMPTSTKHKPVYEKFGEAHFELDGEKIVLAVYQSHDLRQKEEYKDYLFLPFKDLTNGRESYGGGRYIELSIPEGDTIIIDFNKAYNPYCAYSARYSCPIPPKENRIALKIPAGVMAPPEHD